jgi:hypothetical protein
VAISEFSGTATWTSTVDYQILDRVLTNENSFFRTPAYSFGNELFAVFRPHLKHEN